MTEIITSFAIFAGIVTGVLIIVWLIRLPVEPDPWEGKIHNKELDEDSKPLCLKCSRQVDNFNQYYCPNCGNVTGEYTRYLPFVNIRFNYGIFGIWWKKMIDNKTFFLKRILLFILILLLAPVMLFVGVFVALFYMVKKINNKENIDKE